MAETTQIEPRPAPISPKPERRWYRFSLRTLMVLIAVVAVAFGTIGVMLERAHRQQAAVAILRKNGGQIIYEYMQIAPRTWSSSGRRWEPEWLQRFVSEDIFHSPSYLAIFKEPSQDDAWVPAANNLHNLRTLVINGSTITDETLEKLGPFDRLEELHIYDSQVTDNGLKQLLKFPQLKWLVLDRVPQTDKGCETLAQIPHLQEVTLRIITGENKPQLKKLLQKLRPDLVVQ